jgi:hypothetical protein
MTIADPNGPRRATERARIADRTARCPGPHTGASSTWTSASAAVLRGYQPDAMSGHTRADLDNLRVTAVPFRLTRSRAKSALWRRVAWVLV